MTKARICLVVAAAANGVIGLRGGLPWRLSSDLKQFKALTLGKPVIMGRKTWDSLPVKPLAGRTNIVVTRRDGFQAEGAVPARTPEAALEIAEALGPSEIMVIGGGELYRAFWPKADRIYLTQVHANPAGDTFVPEIDPARWRETERQDHAAGPRDSAAFTVRILDRITATDKSCSP